MNAKKRYGFTFISVILLTLCYYWGSKFREKRQHRKVLRRSYMENDKYLSSDLSSPIDFRLKNSFCNMETCFDYSKCSGRPFKVYVYPEDDNVPPSNSYMKIINVIKDSRFYTNDPNLACAFVLSLDTLDRDSLSQDYVRNMQSRVESLSYWNNGLNHIVFNLYSGTWPDYTEDLGFDIGHAMLAKASISEENYRPGFDISLPLFHKHHPERGGSPGFIKSNNFPVTNKYFLAFKGKRYVHGIGSDTRNSLHHLHNGEDIVMTTTCKHGKNWRELMDERCEEDNAEYDHWDYDNLLSNSTFCLVPRGRRLGSFRFLETLQAGCLPVILSNSWQLPFDEVIDWSSASLSLDERMLLQVPEMLHTVSGPEVFSRRQQTQVIWDNYLSSVEKIVLTSLLIIQERVHPQLARHASVWNSRPGALWTDSSDRFSTSVGLIPLGYSNINQSSTQYRDQFTAMISVSSPLISSSSHVFSLLKNLSNCSSLREVVILWSSSVQPPPVKDWLFLGKLPKQIPLRIIQTNSTSQFFHTSLVSTRAFISLDEDVTLTTQEIEFAFEVWKSFPERIVGFPSRSHYWDEKKKMWIYNSAMSNDYSIVLTNAAFIHKKYAKLFTEYLSVSLYSAITSYRDCQHILMNFLVSDVTKLPPIKVIQRNEYQTMSNINQIDKLDRLSRKQTCMNIFYSAFGRMPLIRSQMRLDPVLFKDSVANMRKKYRKIELVS